MIVSAGSGGGPTWDAGSPLIAVGETLPVGELILELKTSGLAPRLGLVSWRRADGRFDAQVARWRRSRRGVRALVYVPRGVQELWLRLDPGVAITDDILAHRVSPLGSAVRRSWTALCRASWRPLAVPSAVQGSYRVLREKGIRGALHRLRTSTAHGGGSFQEWVRFFDVPARDEGTRIRAWSDGRRALPVFSVLIPDPVSHPSAAPTLESCERQLYPGVQVCLLGAPGAAAANASLTAMSGQYVIFPGPGVRLKQHALYAFAHRLERDPSLDLLYSDEDAIDAGGGRTSPVFKPDWSPELLRSRNYLGDLTAIRTDLIRALGGWNEKCPDFQHELLLRLSLRPEALTVAHVPEILVHRAGSTTLEPDGLDSARCLESTLVKAGVAATVVPGLLPRTFHVRYRLPDKPPLVSILIPTRDRAELLRQCIDSIFQRTRYPSFEVIVVDNGSTDRAALVYLEALGDEKRARIIRDPRPFNFSALNNQGAAVARGSVLCLLNNDVQVISPGWLDEMVSVALQLGVGAVGAKLYYPSGRIQHGGVLAGMFGFADHMYRLLPRDADGYLGQLKVRREVAAVTGACLVVEKSRYERVGGLDEQLPIAFNDVDFCLKLLRSGARNIWTPFAELMHHESVSRGSDDLPWKRERAAQEADQLFARWRGVLEADPFYNPNLSLDTAFPVPAWPPRVPSRLHKP